MCQQQLGRRKDDSSALTAVSAHVLLHVHTLDGLTAEMKPWQAAGSMLACGMQLCADLVQGASM